MLTYWAEVPHEQLDHDWYAQERSKNLQIAVMQKGGRRGSCGLSDLSESFMRTVLSFRLIHADCPIVSEWTIGLSARSGHA